MSRVARYRKNGKLKRKIQKKGTVVYKDKFSDKPSVKSIKNNRVFISDNISIEEKLQKSNFRCFEDWDLDNSGIINESDVENLVSYGYFTEAKLLKRMLSTNTLPKKCYGTDTIVTQRANSINRKLFENSNKKFQSVHRTHKNLKKLKKRNENRRKEA